MLSEAAIKARRSGAAANTQKRGALAAETYRISKRRQERQERKERQERQQLKKKVFSGFQGQSSLGSAKRTDDAAGA